MRELRFGEVDTEDAPTVEYAGHHLHTARKRHACDCCPLPILPGQRYEVVCYVVDGEFQAQKHHRGGCAWPEEELPAEVPFED